jgi:hypothetical protein
MKYICQHLGLGDHLITNGLVRTLINEQENYTMFVKPEYISSVSFMFRDLPNLKFMEGSADSAINFLMSNKIPKEDIIYAGFHWVDRYGSSFDQNFYMQNQVQFENKWSKFYVKRDIERENELFEKLNINEPYIFVHQDRDRNLRISEEKLPSLRILEPDFSYTDNVFDYCKVIEKSESVHCIESSFLLLCDIMGLSSELYLHSYARIHSEKFFIPIYKNVKLIN